MEGNKFEDKWRAAVAGAEANPSDSVWSSIESELITAENQTMKRHVVFYQRLAAACIIFAFMAGAVGYYFGRNNAGDIVATSTTADQLNRVEQIIPRVKLGEEKNLFTNTKTQQEGVKLLPEKPVKEKMISRYRENNSHLPRLVLPDSVERGSVEMAGVQPVNTAAAIDSENRNDLSTQLITVAVQEESPLKMQKQKEESIELAGLTKTSDQPESAKKNRDKESDRLWASLGLSAGNYDPGSISNSNYLASPATASNPGYRPSSTSRAGVGTSYSVGITLGKRVSNRWVIQGGINYLNQNSGYTSDMTSTSNQPQALDLYSASKMSAAQVTFTSPYQINSTLEFISIPLQAGYLLVNRKVGFQMNAGIATDFFIRNSLEDKSGQSNRYSQGAGSASPYKSVNWAGLASTELSYKLGRQYRISLVPGVRYLFNSALKSGATSNSYVVDIGFRFRYVLK